MQMKLKITGFISVLFFALESFSAVLHFYDHPQVKQPLYHVQLEYQGFMYEAEPYSGAHRFPVSKLKDKAKIRIEIADELINTAALKDQLGRKFDYDFIWTSENTYCSKMLGLALGIQPVPMTFAGTHYLDYHPEWISRNDPGLSPDHIYEFGMKHALRVIRRAN